MSDKPRYAPGLVFGQFVGCKSGTTILTVPVAKRWKIYNEGGKEVDGIWERTYNDGLFSLPFQWDAVQIAHLINPHTGKMRIILYSRGGGDPDRYDRRIYFVLNIEQVLSGGRPILKHAPVGEETQKWIERLQEWVKENSKFAKTILSRCKTILSTELACAVVFDIF